MKPLVYYCRWQGAALRLRGRDETAVWGHLVFPQPDGAEERTQPFRYELKTRRITLNEGDAAETVQLDEMGTVVGEQ